MKVSVLIATRDRPECLLRCLESVRAQRTAPHETVVLDDASETLAVADLLRSRRIQGVRTLRAERRLGVGPGRNRLFAAATGDVFFFLDDDACLDRDDTFARLTRVLEQHPWAGIISTKIVDQLDPPRLLIPFPRSARLRDPAIGERMELVSYFHGGAHAVRRALYERIGGYDEHFVWGEEELDLSYRAIQAGFAIVYTPEIVVQHTPGPPVLSDRDDRRSELFYHARNRVLLARRYLPPAYVVPYLFVWMMRYLAAGVRQGVLRDVLRGARSGVDIIRSLPRTPLRGDALAYVRRNHGRLWF